MTKLAERAMLAKLHIGVWSGKAVDRKVTEEVSDDHGADPREAGRYNKQLVASKFLHKVGAVVNYGRTVHRTLTLPWEDDGTRILSTTAYETYVQQMRTVRIQFESAVKVFAGGMPDYLTEARARLGTMFHADEYPSSEEVKAKFGIDVEIRGISEAGDFRAQLSDATVKSIQKDIERRSEQRVKDAMQDVYQRIFDVVSKMSGKLKDYDPSAKGGAFRDSLVYNINDLADLLPMINITQDPKLTSLGAQLKRDLVEHSPEILRTDPKARNETQRRAEAIAKKVKAFLG